MCQVAAVLDSMGMNTSRVAERSSAALEISSVQFSRSVVSDSLQPHESILRASKQIKDQVLSPFYTLMREVLL